MRVIYLYTFCLPGHVGIQVNYLIRIILIAAILLSLSDFAFSKVESGTETSSKNTCLSVEYKANKSSSQCIYSGKTKRMYQLYVPEGVINNPGLIIALHGGGSSAKILENYSALNSLSQQNKQFIVAYPQATNKLWNDGRMSTKYFDSSQSQDVQLIKDIITQLASLNIDQSRVGIIGISNGGLMSQRLACEFEHSDYTYGIVAATMSVELKDICSSQKQPQKIIYFFGDQDTAFLTDGKLVNPVKPKQIRGHHMGIKKSIDVWLKRNQCTSDYVSLELPDKYNKKWGKWKDDHTTVHIKQWENCLLPVVWYKVKGGGHRWADRDAKNGLISRNILNLGWASHEFSTAKTFWDFMMSDNKEKK
ncbi:MAG: hypothetical protein OQL19_10810 [Gammaproteobacteria bacterium]|nr:hypothetical protein [Gammaproteobacteria bacterium]